ncbi:hypothetical protein [Maribellus mangrovi]|uniref:hypothetical protein n=1 Tax=Maribellus mangrovi TaxID=3133146 RepID=UPI0030ED0E04
MRYFFVVLVFVLLYGLQSCNQAGKPEKLVPVIIKTDSCQQDPKHTYEVFVPQRKNTVEKLPVVILLDAHGGGKLALNRFKAGAEQYPVILAASNLVKNAYANYPTAIQTLLEEVRQKYPTDQTVFISGFSGAARMALGYASSHPVNGLIMCGALSGADQIRALSCPVISISGMDDFNFVETAQYLFQEQTIPGNLKIELTNASHSWPDSSMLADALGFLYLSENPSADKSLIKAYCNNQHERIDKLKQQGDFLKATLLAWNMSSTAPFNTDKDFAAEFFNLKTGDDYKSQVKKLEKCLKFEMSVRQPYLEALTTKDSLWWQNEINSINKKLSTEQDSFNVDMYRRIKAFWGIACYSLGNQAIAKKESAKLENILAAYKILEPENPETLFFSAFLLYWKGDQEETISTLKKAREAGFSETDRLKSAFPKNIISQLDL